jgi:hypothetical protein
MMLTVVLKLCDFYKALLLIVIFNEEVENLLPGVCFCVRYEPGIVSLFGSLCTRVTLFPSVDILTKKGSLQYKNIISLGQDC